MRRLADTRIEWADAVWNCVTGCSKVSAGCKHCYAERMAQRFAGRNGYPADEPFRVTLHPDKLDLPLHWKKPRKIFVNSMSDLFHSEVPDEFIRMVWDVMRSEDSRQHTFQILTERPARMMELLQRWDWNLRDIYDQRPLPNVWLGVSVENQQTADERIPLLLQTPAAVRFVSAEPLLGPINLEDVAFDRERAEAARRKAGGVGSPYPLDEWRLFINRDRCLDWVIAGGESGPGARPMEIEWARSLRDQCAAAGAAFFMKQITSRGRKAPKQSWPADLLVEEYPDAR